MHLVAQPVLVAQRPKLRASQVWPERGRLAAQQVVRVLRAELAPEAQRAVTRPEQAAAPAPQARARLAHQVPQAGRHQHWRRTPTRPRAI
jgi:hypothetical protein